MSPLDAIMRTAPVIPVLVMDDVAQAALVAGALARGGLPVIEVTLRTSSALDMIRTMAAIRNVIVGAGTVLTVAQMDDAIEAGARFIVSPGLSRTLTDAATMRGIPFLPGVATASDIMRGLELGLNRFKFFPAEAAGGLAALRAISAAFKDVQFCPTGGIDRASAPVWLAEPTVACVGGSWLARAGMDLAAIEEAAREARAFAA